MSQNIIAKAVAIVVLIIGGIVTSLVLIIYFDTVHKVVDEFADDFPENSTSRKILQDTNQTLNTLEQTIEIVGDIEDVKTIKEIVE